jgi:cell division protein FtsL
MSSNTMYFRWTLKQAYMVKHALRDKPNKDDGEQKIYEEVTEEINRFKERYRIPDIAPEKHYQNKEKNL